MSNVNRNLKTLIRRAGNVQSNSFSPRQLAGCTLWLRGDLGVTLTGGKVSTWADQSGNGHDVVQANAALRPTPVASSATLNNLPAISFDHATGTYLQGLFAAFVTACTMAVAYTSVGAFGSCPCSSAQAGVGFVSLLNNQGAVNDPALTRPANITQDVGHGTATSVVIGTADANTGNLYVNQKSVTDANGTAAVIPAPQDTFDVGNLVGNEAAFGWNGEIAEVVVFDRILTAAEIASLGYYLGIRYGISVAN